MVDNNADKNFQQGWTRCFERELGWLLILVLALIDFASFIGRAEFSARWNRVAGIGVTLAFMSNGLFVMLHGRRKQNTVVQVPA